MSAAHIFEISRPFIRSIAVFKIGRLARRAGLLCEFGDKDTRLRITVTGDGGQLQDFCWTLKDEFGDQIREVTRGSQGST